MRTARSSRAKIQLPEPDQASLRALGEASEAGFLDLVLSFEKPRELLDISLLARDHFPEDELARSTLMVAVSSLRTLADLSTSEIAPIVVAAVPDAPAALEARLLRILAAPLPQLIAKGVDLDGDDGLRVHDCATTVDLRPIFPFPPSVDSRLGTPIGQATVVTLKFDVEDAIGQPSRVSLTVTPRDLDAIADCLQHAKTKVELVRERFLTEGVTVVEQ